MQRSLQSKANTDQQKQQHKSKNDGARHESENLRRKSIVEAHKDSLVSKGIDYSLVEEAFQEAIVKAFRKIKPSLHSAEMRGASKQIETSKKSVEHHSQQKEDSTGSSTSCDIFDCPEIVGESTSCDIYECDEETT